MSEIKKYKIPLLSTFYIDEYQKSKINNSYGSWIHNCNRNKIERTEDKNLKYSLKFKYYKYKRWIGNYKTLEEAKNVIEEICKEKIRKKEIELKKLREVKRSIKIYGKDWLNYWEII